MSVDIAMPHACSLPWPALNARKTSAGTTMPTSPTANGSRKRRRSRRSPRSNSRRVSSPTTRKKKVIRPLLTHSLRSYDGPCEPSLIESSVCQKEW